MENAWKIQASILSPKLCQNVNNSDSKSTQITKKCTKKAPTWSKKNDFLRIKFLVRFRLRRDGSQDFLSGPQADPGPAGHPQNLKTDVRNLAGIWTILRQSGGYIRDKSFLAAPPCPQTPKPPNYQKTGRLSIWSCSHTLDRWRVGGYLNIVLCKCRII